VGITSAIKMKPGGAERGVGGIETANGGENPGERRSDKAVTSDDAQGLVGLPGKHHGKGRGEENEMIGFPASKGGG
jgi:hypothetical protein